MRKLFIILVISSWGIVISCNIDKNNKTIEASTSIPATEPEVKLPAPITKYVIVVVHFSEESTISFSGLDMPPIISSKNFIYTSDIYTVNNYSDDNKYRVADDFIIKVKEEFDRRESISKTNSDLSKKCKIINREMLVFDTYAEASIYKEKNY